MITKISGKVTSVFPDDINTDDIIPAWTLQESSDRKFFQKYAFVNYDPEFVNRCAGRNNNIIIAGKNFGCGSSREQAVYALQENNVVAVIARSFPDIFYRNCLNNGLTLVTLPSIPNFQIGTEIAINLEKHTITTDNKIIPFFMSFSDRLSFSHGGKIARLHSHLADIFRSKKKKRIDYTKSRISAGKPQTMAEKILSDHLDKAVYAGERIERLPIDILFLNEVIAPPAIKDFYHNCADVFGQYNKKPRVFDPKRIFLIPDHTVPSSSVLVSEGITYMEEFAKEQRILCYKEGDGIEHVVLIEDGYIVPGEIILGTDSHTDTNGALNTLAFGVGTTDTSYALATGYLYDFEVPQAMRINLKGVFKKGVSSKDLILHLIGKLGVDGAVGKIVEFGGPALENLSMDSRTTIANMAVEMGARTGIFEFDQILAKYLRKRARFTFKAYMPDRNAEYEKVIEVDLSKLEPCVAFPHKPSNVTFVSKMEDFRRKSLKSKSTDFVPVTSLKITDAFLGACTNGRFEDFLVAAKILKGKKVHPDVNFVAIPASRKVYNKLLHNGILGIFAEAGVNIESSNCGPCFGKHMGVVGKGAQMISSSNRNYIGRMGSKDAKIFLASPATVAASAIAGKITDPRDYLPS